MGLYSIFALDYFSVIPHDIPSINVTSVENLKECFFSPVRGALMHAAQHRFMAIFILNYPHRSLSKLR
jgi:hypothetical protein